MTFQYFNGFLHPKFSSRNGLNLLRVFASFAVILIIPACVEQSEMTPDKPSFAQKESVSSMITRQTTAAQDWANYLTHIDRIFFSHWMMEKCGTFHIPEAISGMDVRSSKDRAREIEAAIDAYPQKVACARENMQPVSRDYLAYVADTQNARRLIAQKISAGLYDKSSTEFTYLGTLTPTGRPSYATYAQDVQALETKIATAVTRGQQNLRAANGDIRRAQSRRNAWVSAGLSAGIASAAQSAGREAEISRQAQNRVREVAGLPKILSRAEQKALQDAYNWSLAQAAKEPLASSGASPEASTGGSSGGAMLTLTTETPTECTHSLGNSPTPLTISDCNAYRNQRDIEANEIWEAEQAAKAAEIEAERARLAEEKRNAPYDDGCGNIYPNLAAYQAYLNSLPKTDGSRVICQ